MPIASFISRDRPSPTSLTGLMHAAARKLVQLTFMLFLRENAHLCLSSARVCLYVRVCLDRRCCVGRHTLEANMHKSGGVFSHGEQGKNCNRCFTRILPVQSHTHTLTYQLINAGTTNTRSSSSNDRVCVCVCEEGRR